jgi:hypothetical protein
MKVKGAYWFSGMNFHIGIVVGEDEFTKEHKGYISTVPGLNEAEDMQHIADLGSPVSPAVMAEIGRYLSWPAR